MKKTLTFVLALVLVLCMAMPALAIDVELPIVSEPTTYTIMVRKEDLSQNTWPEKECVIYTEEQTGIHIEWIEVPGSGWTEKVNLAFASGDLPDAFIGGVDVVSNMDVLAPIDEIIDSGVAPNILQMFSEVPDMRGALTVSDGHLYSLPTGDADVKNQVNSEMWINTVWLEKLGLQVPTNIDEMYDVLVAFRDQDPNGNGLKDEIPLLVSASTGAAKLNGMFGFFGTIENNDHVRVQDGKVIFTPTEDGYFEALKWFNKLYTEGLMNQEYFTEDYQQFLAKGNAETNVTGMFLEWYIDNIMLSTYVPEYAFVEPFEGTIWSKDNSRNSPQGTLNGFVITEKCANPTDLVRWYDYINSNLDILNLWNYGPENLIWRYTDDGRWELFTDNVPEGSSSSQIRRTMGTGPTSPIYAYSRFRGPQAEVFADRINAKVAANEVYLKYAPAENIPNGFGDAEEEAERNMLLVEIDHYLDQFKAKAVVDGITEEDWQQHLKTLEGLAIDEYVGYWQSFYDTHK